MGTPILRLPLRLIFLVAVLLGLSPAIALPRAVSAHLEEPTNPIVITLSWSNVAMSVNHDDTDTPGDLGPAGAKAEPLIEYTISHAGHGPGISDAAETTYDFANPLNGFPFGAPAGGVGAVGPIIIYEHIECSPQNAIRLDVRAWETDPGPLPDTFLGNAHHVFPGNSAPVVVVLTPAGGKPANGIMTLDFFLNVGPAPAAEGRCPAPRR
jgi:hypothetical protein